MKKHLKRNLKKEISYMLNENTMITDLIVG